MPALAPEHAPATGSGGNLISAAGAARFFVPLADVLHQLAQVLAGLTDAQYNARGLAQQPGSIGSHVRHCLDHMQALLDAAATGRVNYDERNRGTAVETDPVAARQRIHSLRQRLLEWHAGVGPDEPLIVSALMVSCGPPLRCRSSLGREAVFVLSHTIHHNAIIAAMVKALRGRLPDRFGYAPSTSRHLEQQACAEQRACVR